MLADRLGVVRVVLEQPRDDGLLALLLGSLDPALRIALDSGTELGRCRPGARGALRHLGCGRTVQLPPLPRAAVRRRAAARSSPRRIRPLLAAGVDVFAYFRHEEEPSVPAVRRRLLALLRD